MCLFAQKPPHNGLIFDRIPDHILKTASLSNFCEINSFSTKAAIDFTIHRAPCYIRRMYTVSAEIFSRRHTTGFSIDLLSDENIIKFFTRTGASQHVKYDPKTKIPFIRLSEVLYSIAAMD